MVKEKVMRSMFEDQAIEQAIMQATDDVLHDRAIANVRAMQEAQLEDYRQTVDQDELEVAEWNRLRKEAKTIIRKSLGRMERVRYATSCTGVQPQRGNPKSNFR